MKSILSKRTTLLLTVLLSICLPLAFVYAAAVETPKGKRIPGQIVDETEKGYKIGSDLPGGGRIIFNADKANVDPHGTVPGKGRIEDIKGKAEIKRAGTPRFFPASKGAIVNPGDEIRTTQGSEVVITLENMAINSLSGNTTYSLKSLEVDPETKSVQVQVNLPQGKLWSEVGRLKTKDSSFIVETPAAVTGVRGTVFRVEVEQATAKTNVSVVAGEVAVSSKGVEAPAVIVGKQQALSVQAGAPPEKLSPSELIQHLVLLVEEWAKQSEYFQMATALAGIGEVEEIEVEPTLPEAQRQQVYDAIQAGWEKASEDFFQVDKALKMFYLDFARFPTTQEGLQALISNPGTPQWNGPYTDTQYLKDYYDEPYGYVLSTDAYGNAVVEVITFGHDKKPGTPDDRRKIITEEDARRWEDTKSYR
jgi:type II secretory pathway pseudopilin PulG